MCDLESDHDRSAWSDHDRHPVRMLRENKTCENFFFTLRRTTIQLTNYLPRAVTAAPLLLRTAWSTFFSSIAHSGTVDCSRTLYIDGTKQFFSTISGLLGPGAYSFIKLVIPQLGTQTHWSLFLTGKSFAIHVQRPGMEVATFWPQKLENGSLASLWVDVPNKCH